MTTATFGRSAAEQLRMLSVAARLYHVQSFRQCEIAERLGVSQASVSRLLREAEHQGIVKKVVEVPAGLHPLLEEQIEEAYGLSEVHVVEVVGGEDAISPTLASAAARIFLARPLGAVVGFTPTDPTLRDMALAQADPLLHSCTRFVVELVPRQGSALDSRHAAQAMRRLADALGATPVALQTAGQTVVQTAVQTAGTGAIEPRTRGMRGLLDRLDIAFLEVTSVGPGSAGSLLLAEGEARARVNRRRIDACGLPVGSPDQDRPPGVTLSQIASAHRRIVVTGGRARHTALVAALRGGWVDSLMTDLETARQLAQEAGAYPLQVGDTPH